MTRLRGMPLFNGTRLSDEFTGYIFSQKDEAEIEDFNYSDLESFLHILGKTFGFDNLSLREEKLNLREKRSEEIGSIYFRVFHEEGEAKSAYLLNRDNTLMHFYSDNYFNKFSSEPISFMASFYFDSDLLKDTAIEHGLEEEEVRKFGVSDSISVKEAIPILKSYKKKLAAVAKKAGLTGQQTLDFAFVHELYHRYMDNWNLPLKDIGETAEALKLGLSIEKTTWLLANNFSAEVAELYRDAPTSWTVRI